MVKVAAAQVRVSKDSDKNFFTIIRYIKKASQKKVDIVCFPECALAHSNNKKTLEKIPIEKYIEKIRKACKESKIHCIFGTHYYSKGRITNSAFMIDDSGKILHRYDKVNLWKREDRKVSRGAGHKAIKTKFGKIGIIICWDIAYPEYVKELAKKGAWVIFWPSYIKNYGRELESYLQIPYVRAFENSCYVVQCDSANKDCAQYSVICSTSEKIKEIKKGEGLIVAELGRRKIASLRRYYRLV